MFEADKKQVSKTQSVTQKKSATEGRFAFTDNRPKTIQMKQLQRVMNNSTQIQKAAQTQSLLNQNSRKTSLGSDHSSVVIQRVAKTKSWTSQQNKYEKNSIGKGRITGDAEWLAITRFAEGVSEEFKSTHTVQQVMDEAAKLKHVSYDDWKGKGDDGTSREAQHLVTAGFATETLKWPFSEINSADNGKMLLAGRKGRGVKYTPEYLRSKELRHPYLNMIPRSIPGFNQLPRNIQRLLLNHTPVVNRFASRLRMFKPDRGLKHIGKGVAHPKYNEMSEVYVRKYYQDHGLTIGKPIHRKHARAIKKGLRKWHKEDQDMDGMAIDQKAITNPI